MHQLRDEIGEAWEGLVHGWQRLYGRAGAAITRFSARGQGQRADLSTVEDQETALRSAGWGVLAAEVHEEPDRIVVRLEAPGLDKEDIDVQVVQDFLVIRGEKHLERERSEGRYHIAECAYGSFERAIPLPQEVDASKARASYRNGVLKVELTKPTGSRSRSIQVDIG
jgi:HSP20 family protein